MSRELESYRLHREDLKENFGDKQLLTITDVMKYTGIKDYYTTRKRFGVTKDGITQVDFAYKLSHLTNNK